VVPFAPRFKSMFVLIACLVGALAMARAEAQVPVTDASDLHEPTSFAEGWLVQTGDNPAWADPNYDDSHWARFNAHTDSLHTLFPHQRPDVVWYRLHITVAPHDTDLAVEEYYLSSAFEIYSNGVKILSVGTVSPYSGGEYRGRLLGKIPRDQIASGRIVLAVRTHIGRAEWTNAFPGFYYYNLVFGMEEAVRQHIWLGAIGQYALEVVGTLLALGMIAGGLLLYSAQRRPEYLFLALTYIVGILPELLSFYGSMHTFPVWWWVLSSLSKLVYPYLLARTYLAFIARPVGWRMNAFLAFVGIVLWVEVMMELMNTANIFTILASDLPMIALTFVVLPAILISAMRRGNRDAGILVVPLLLASSVKVVDSALFGLAQIPALRATMWPLREQMNHMAAGPFQLPPAQIASILGTLSLALIILLRSNRQSRQQAVLEGEIANAREVQEVIVPEGSAAVPGFRVESVYEPAKEVGGDFFQTIPDGRGGLLVVVGDVAGKGLPAAMMVSVLVGSIRSVAEFTSEPDEILAHLNRRLVGRTQGGFSTAIAAHIAANGTVRIANAGHLPPYLDGRELELPGALPLGVDARVRYEAHTIELPAGSRLVFYSDGVVEAQNASGELLGFERAAALSTESAEKISQAAKAFGQADDITVVTIAREMAAAAAA
jgi:phosphoserine phosphatase RsbU/P